MSIVAGAKKLFGGMTYTDWAFAHFTTAMALLWALPFTLSVPVRVLMGWEYQFVWSFVVFLGSLLSIVGIVASSHRGKARRRGFHIEAVGLMLMAAGPLSYMGMQAGLWVQTGDPRQMSIGLAYLLLASIAARLIMVYAAVNKPTVPVTFPRRND